MAAIQLASFLKSLSGSIGGMVFYTKYGREYARVYVKPSNPDTPGQRAVRRTFGDAVRSWQVLPRHEKDRYNRQARRLAMSGYNLFVSRYMKKHVAIAIMAVKEHDYCGIDKEMILSPSVFAPFRHKNSVYAAFKPPAESPGLG